MRHSRSARARAAQTVVDNERRELNVARIEHTGEFIGADVVVHSEHRHSVIIEP